MTFDDFNSQEFPILPLTSETLTCDSTSTLYEEQETAMTDYPGKLVHDAAIRGPSQTLIINALQSPTTDLADVTHDCNTFLKRKLLAFPLLLMTGHYCLLK